MHSGPGARRVGGSGNIGTFPVENQRREVFVIGKSRRVNHALNKFWGKISFLGENGERQPARDRL